MPFEGVFKTKNKTYIKDGNTFIPLNLTPRVYEKCPSSNMKFIDDTPVCKITFNNIWDKKKYVEQFKDLKTIIDYDEWIDIVYEKYWKKETPDPTIVYLDIETIDLNNRKFPEPHKAEAPITHIQLMNGKTGKIVILYLKEPSNELKEKYKDVKFIKCNNEYQMLDYYSKIIKKWNPTIITAYNGRLFDFPYIFFRAKKLKFDINNLSPLNETTFKVEFKNNQTGEYKKYYDISKLNEFLRTQNLDDWKLVEFELNAKGVYHIDYLDVFKKFMFEDQPSYKLEYIAYKFLGEGEGKVNYGEYSSIFEFYEKNYDKFFEYAIQDPKVIYNLENKLKLIELKFF